MILVTVLLLAANAFFVAGQFALISVRADQLQPKVDAGSRTALIAQRQIRQLPTMLAASQLGIALCSLALGAAAEPALAHQFERVVHAAGLPEAMVHPIALVGALALVSYAHMVLGEMVPKNLSLAGPVRAAIALGPPMAAWVRLTGPVVRFVNGVANQILRLFRVEPKEEISTAYTTAELRHVITESVAEGFIQPDEERRLERALALERRPTLEVTVPMTRLVSVPEGVTRRDLEKVAAETGFSRFPLRSATAPDQLIGFLHVKDMLDVAEMDTPLPTTMIRPLVTVDRNTPLLRACTALQQEGAHLGRVVADERTVGVVALEDILEELVGEVHDASHRS